MLGCDGGRSTVRERLGIPVEGESLPEKFMLVDLKVDLDVTNPRDYPYLAYFSDPREWMILVRHPTAGAFCSRYSRGARSRPRRICATGVAFIGPARRCRFWARSHTVCITAWRANGAAAAFS